MHDQEEEADAAMQNSVISLTLLDPPPSSPRSALHSPRPRLSSAAPLPPEGAPPMGLEMIPQTEAPVMQEYSGLELLHRVFDSMAINDKITMDQLPFVLAGAEVQATAEQVQEAIEEYLPDADDEEALLDFDQVQTLYQQLFQVMADHMADALLLAAEQEQRPSPLRRAWQWLQQKHKERKLRQTAYERSMKPTTRLLLLILATSCAISTAVVVFSVVSIFDHSNTAVIDHLVRDTELLADGLSLFGYTRPFEHTTNNLQRLSTILGVVIDELGYANTRAYQLSNLEYQRNLLGDLLDGWYSNDAVTTVDTAATIVSLWVERMVARGTTLAELVDAFNAVNPNLPAGHEIQLARSAPGGGLQFLTALRFAAGCAGVCGANNGSTSVWLALAGANGSTVAGVDYRPQAVAAGYRLLANPAVALVYYVQQTILQQEFRAPVRAVVEAINGKLATEVSNPRPDLRVNTQEVVLSVKVSGAVQNLTTLRFCNATCMRLANMETSYLGLGLNGTGSGVSRGLNGEPTFLAYAPLPHAGLGLTVKVSQEEFLDALYLSLGDSLDDVNAKVLGSLDLQLVTKPKATDNVTTNGMKYWTAFQAFAMCNTTCGTVPGTSAYLQRALTGCVSGTDHGLDYLSQMVTAAYACVPALGAAFSITIADSEIIAEGTSMAVTIANYQSFTRYANQTTEVVIARKNAGVAVAQIRSDYKRLSTRKFDAQCPNGVCNGPATTVVNAVNGLTGYVEYQDYRWVWCYSAYTYLPNLDLGVAVKIDKSEAQENSFRLTGILCGASVSAVLASMAVLALLANVLLRSMDRTWEEGKRAIEQEKLAFRAVIEAMYPAEVAERMLMGETHIVYDVPAATVFFSDIYEFTTTSNTVTPEELIRFMGYTFGAMDTIGDYYHVYKVKTIGDAYLGASGLPGMTSVNGSPTMDMMLFASACAQIFSNRFLHPDEGTILSEIVTRVLRKKNLLKGLNAAAPAAAGAAAYPRRPSAIGYGPPSDAAGASAAGEGGQAGAPLIHCIMRYGLAMGPITAGVLQGKTPLFDIWGKTVNLASRMESTGQAGRIQVAEGVYQAALMYKNQPFTFEARHKVYCKGFGHVSAYFVSSCAVAPPKELLAALHIEPNWGHYLFHNPVPAFNAKGPQDGSGSASGNISPRSQLSHNSHRRG